MFPLVNSPLLLHLIPIFLECSSSNSTPSTIPASPGGPRGRLHRGQILFHVLHGALDEFPRQTPAAEVLSDAQGQDVGQGATGATCQAGDLTGASL